MNDDMLGGLNDLVNMADKQPGSKPGPRQSGTARSPEGTAAASGIRSSSTNPAFPQAAPDNAFSQQILDRLDAIRTSLDALKQQRGVGDKQFPDEPCVDAALPIPLEKPRVPPRPAVPSPVVPPTKSQPPQQVLWPYLVLVSAALELVAFALGMGYGAVVASGKFPFWYRPGVAGVLIDWVGAPAGALLLPVVAGLLVLGGRELQREGRDTAAKAVWAVAGGLAVIALLVPFIA